MSSPPILSVVAAKANPYDVEFSAGWKTPLSSVSEEGEPLIALTPRVTAVAATVITMAPVSTAILQSLSSPNTAATSSITATSAATTPTPTALPQSLMPPKMITAGACTKGVAANGTTIKMNGQRFSEVICALSGKVLEQFPTSYEDASKIMVRHSVESPVTLTWYNKAPAVLVKTFYSENYEDLSKVVYFRWVLIYELDAEMGGVIVYNHEGLILAEKLFTPFTLKSPYCETTTTYANLKKLFNDNNLHYKIVPDQTAASQKSASSCAPATGGAVTLHSVPDWMSLFRFIKRNTSHEKITMEPNIKPAEEIVARGLKASEITITGPYPHSLIYKFEFVGDDHTSIACDFLILSRDQEYVRTRLVDAQGKTVEWDGSVAQYFPPFRFAQFESALCVRNLRTIFRGDHLFYKVKLDEAKLKAALESDQKAKSADSTATATAASAPPGDNKLASPPSITKSNIPKGDQLTLSELLNGMKVRMSDKVVIPYTQIKRTYEEAIRTKIATKGINSLIDGSYLLVVEDKQKVIHFFHLKMGESFMVNITVYDENCEEVPWLLMPVFALDKRTFKECPAGQELVKIFEGTHDTYSFKK